MCYGLAILHRYTPRCWHSKEKCMYVKGDFRKIIKGIFLFLFRQCSGETAIYNNGLNHTWQLVPEHLLLVLPSSVTRLIGLNIFHWDCTFQSDSSGWNLSDKQNRFILNWKRTVFEVKGNNSTGNKQRQDKQDHTETRDLLGEMRAHYLISRRGKFF